MTGRARSRSRDEAGVAFATAILFALVILMAGHGILLFARTQRWIAAVDGARWVEDETRRAALIAATAGLDSLPQAGALVTPSGVVEVRSLGAELRLLAVGVDPGSPGTGWASLLAAPGPVARAADRSGAARVGGGVFAGGTAPDGSDEACPIGLEGVTGPRVGPLPDDARKPRLGVLDFEDLVAALPALAGDRLDLPLGGDAACEEVDGFGDPDRPGSCPGIWGAASRFGDLTLSGRGQGVLAVTGDLTVNSESRFRGWVWVGGSVRIAPGAELQGLVDVGNRLVVEPGGAFVADRCSGARALEATPILRAPKRVGPRAWPWFRP